MLSRMSILELALILCVFTQISFANEPPFPQSVIQEMASRQMRYHHFLWHQVRDNWNRFPESTRAEFRGIGWAPPNPSKDSKGQTIMNNFAGEEFLYMHRDMIAHANQIIAQNKDPYGKIKGWTTVPAPNDKTYPVPPPFKQGSNPKSLANFKTDDYYYSRIQKAEKALKDPVQLRKMTLNELGKKIESGIHNDMHMRWAAYSPVGYRGGGSLNNGMVNINKQWDDISYDWLVDTYSSHVNPIFWKLHGWIDDRIEDWRVANGLSSIRWQGTWTGGPMSSLGAVMKMKLGKAAPGEEDSKPVGDLLQKAMDIFMQSGVKESNFEDFAMVISQPIKKNKSRRCKSTNVN